MRRSRSAFRISKDKPRRVVQDLAVVDDFGEVRALKRVSSERARVNGHQMSGWHLRPNDVGGRWNSFCRDCNRAAVVQTEPLHAYGPALDVECKNSGWRGKE